MASQALNGDAILSERTLTLHPHLRSIQVGRASKTPSKGLQAAVDNAWFDSPVMSRNHAEILLNAENKICIQDIGSMHGTFLNDSQLGQHEPQELSNGDMVIFGAEVKRNLDIFPACAFKVNYELLPFKTNVSYAFPESDEEDYEVSDNEENEEPSSEDGASIESQPHKISHAIDAIDLTRDDSPANSDVECTGETCIEKNVIITMAGRPANIGHNADPVSVALYSGNPPILIGTDDEDVLFSSDSDDQSEVEYGDNASSCSRGDSIDEQDSEEDDSSGHEIDEEEETEMRNLPDKESERISGLAKAGLHTLMSQPIPESNLRSIIDTSEVVEEEDHDYASDFGLSDAGAEGFRALFDNGLIDNDGDAYFRGEEKSDAESVIAYEAPTDAPIASDKFEAPKRVTFASVPSEQSAEMTSNFSLFNTFAQSQNENFASQTNMQMRQPSPSDAAMVKTATPSTTILNDSTDPVRVHHLPSRDCQSFTSPSLGEKTGKHAFFAAREDNRAKIYGGQDDQLGRNSSFPTAKTNPILAAEEKKGRSLITMSISREIQRRMEEAAKSGAINSTISSFPGGSYLDDHNQALKAIRPLSPEPDMTSAVTYNESKAFMALSNKLSSNPSGRSGLSINDIIEGTAGGHNSKILKRKAGDISDAMENEIRVWASSSPALDSLKRSPAMSASASQAANFDEQFETVSAQLTQTLDERPTKRLRRIVESVGYIALGGATLFGALVLSAPDFL